MLGWLASIAVIVIAGLFGTWLNQRFAASRIQTTPLTGAAAETSSPVPGVGATATVAADATLSSTGEDAPVTLPIQGQETTPTPMLSGQPRLTPTPALAPATPPDDWTRVVEDSFDANTNGWLVSDSEDDWGSVSRQLVDGTYRWEIVAMQAVGRWCTPELPNSAGIVGDFYVSVDAQRLEGPTTAAYGLILHQDEGSYYLFSVRDDGFFQFSLWSGFAWQPIVDWTQTEAIETGEVNHLTAVATGNRFQLYINDASVAEAEDDQLPRGEVGLAISTAATDGQATFIFDNFSLWAPPQ